MPSRSWPEAVLFDLDGTLADSLPDIAASLNVLMRERGWPPFGAEDVRLMVGGGVPKLIERALRALGDPADADDIAALAKRFLAIYAPRAARLTKLFPGAQTLLRGLQDQGVALGVVTNKPEAVSRSMLDALGVAGMVGAVVGGDTLPVKKPDARPMLAALDTLGCAPEAAVMIGDSAVDAEAARAAGMALILVTFGYTRKPVDELGADAVVDSFAEVPKVLDALRP
jgi:phosphoglycolate phosphatase